MKIAERHPLQDSDWRDGFLFVGNHLALDFLNTRPMQNGEAQELLPDYDALLRWFAAAGLLSPEQVREVQKWTGSARAQSATEVMRELREKLRKDLVRWEHGGRVRAQTIDELNRLMAQRPMLTRVHENRNKLNTESWFEARQPDDLFAPVAYAAATLFANADRDRVRQCGHCVLHFYDTSKKGTRRWCSMRLCGNRLKVAAYAARQRSRGKKYAS